VLCFFQDVINDLCEEGKLKEIGHLSSEIGKNPVYTYGNGSDGVTVIHPGVGAPLAAAFLEELIANGVTKFIACGGAGVLDRSREPGYPFILTSAIRDEGTSYHYLPPSREVKPHPAAVQALENACRDMGVEYELGKTWTTDAIYRETKGKRKDRIEEGCWWWRWRQQHSLPWRNSARSSSGRTFTAATWCIPMAGMGAMA
jgi:uridine phosphorylase